MKRKRQQNKFFKNQADHYSNKPEEYNKMQHFFLEKLTIVLKIKVKYLNWKTVKGQIKTYNFKR